MRLVLVHGMRQEGKDPDVLQDSWVAALHAAWKREGLAIPDYDLKMPFYGDELERLTAEARGSTEVVAKGGGGEAPSADEADMMREYGEALGITDEEIAAERANEVVAKGMANWGWVHAIARIAERRVPLFGVIALDFVRQVEAYLTRQHITAAVDGIVRPALTGERCVVVAHSLGTVVSYWLLRKAGPDCDVPLFVTAGSPLGIHTVKRRLQPPRPLARPEGVRRWVNATDERDYVALYARLDRDSFAPDIENFDDVTNSRADAHSITEYLSHTAVAKSIFHALTN
ncbi:MAG TPA: hypothetical protein VF782_12620 [Allosphingosinicella sp.]|jgi:hypothetical protein